MQIAHRLPNAPGSQLSSNNWKLTSVAYQRLDDTMYVKARTGSYGGDPANLTPSLAGSSLFGFAAFQNNGELDPTRSQSPGYGNASYAAWKWTGGFTRLGAQFNISDFTGTFSSGWVAGVGSEKARVFNVLMDESAGRLAGVGFFGFGAPMQGGVMDMGRGTFTADPYDGLIDSFICNWTNVGQANGNTRGQYTDRAQMQVFALASGGSHWQVVSNKLAYAPSSTCADTGLVNTVGGSFQVQQYDASAANSLRLQAAPTADSLQRKDSSDSSIKDYIRRRLGAVGFASWI